MRIRASALAVGFLLLLAAPVLAHHPFAAEYDWKKPVTLTGTVTKFDWGNPHSYIYIEAKDSTGKIANWKIEMGGPASLTRLGWKQGQIKPGDMVTVDAWQAKSGAMMASAKSVTFNDGRELFAASSFFENQRPGSQNASVPTARPAATSGTTPAKPEGNSGKKY